MNRREALRSIGASALVAVASVATCTRIAGAQEDTRYRSEKFGGDGWYAFCGSDLTRKRVMWAKPADADFFVLSDGAAKEPILYVSHRQFDRACWGSATVGRA